MRLHQVSSEMLSSLASFQPSTTAEVRHVIVTSQPSAAHWSLDPVSTFLQTFKPGSAKVSWPLTRDVKLKFFMIDDTCVHSWSSWGRSPKSRQKENVPPTDRLAAHGNCDFVKDGVGDTDHPQTTSKAVALSFAGWSRVTTSFAAWRNVL